MHVTNGVLIARRWHCSTGVLVGLSLIVSSGCGSAEPRIVPVTGEVKFEGRTPAEVCRLTFVPKDDGSGRMRPSGAEMLSSGEYEVTEFRGVRGLYPGTYTVRVAFYDLMPGGNRQNEGDWIARHLELPDPLVVDSEASSVNFDVVVPSS